MFVCTRLNTHCFNRKETTTTMAKTPQQKTLLSGEVSGVDEKLLVLMQRLGMASLPAHETLLLPLERILVPGEELLARPSQRLVKSIATVGILQSPAVMLQTGSALHDEAAVFSAILGRRRLLAARLVGLPVVKCEAYETGTPQLQALLSLIENEQRSAAWVKEVQDLRALIDEGVGMTLADLAAFGFERNALNERLKMAQLPQPIVSLICAGKLKQEVAKKIARLRPAQQARLAQLAEEGNEITAEQVKSVLRAQINTGFAPLQAALAQSWSPPTTTPAVPTSDHGVDQSTGGVAEEVIAALAEFPSEPRAILTSMLTTLQNALPQLQSLGAQGELQRIQLLTTTLIQLLQVALREVATSTRSNDHTDNLTDDHQAHSQQEGELVHV